jgi:hypothetical protein
MRAVLVGDGPHAAEVLHALKSHSRVVVAAQVAHGPAQAGIPVYPAMESALGAGPVELVVLAGDFDAAAIESVVRGAWPVLVANASRLSRDSLGVLRHAAGARKAGIYLARDPGYADGATTLRRLFDSGRLGLVGHVSCEDRRQGPLGVNDGAGHWLRRGGVLLTQVCGLMGTEAQDVMARIDDDHGVTEAYLATRRGIHVHYTGTWQAAVESHCLWIEGTKGALRCDGRAVWWRKRGWRFFVPVGLSDASGAAILHAAVDRIMVDLGKASAWADDHAALGIVVAALASAADREPQLVEYNERTAAA